MKPLPWVWCLRWNCRAPRAHTRAGGGEPLRPVADRRTADCAACRHVPETFVELMARDKKVVDGRLRLVLLAAIGEACIVDDVQTRELIELLQNGLKTPPGQRRGVCPAAPDCAEYHPLLRGTCRGVGCSALTYCFADYFGLIMSTGLLDLKSSATIAASA